MLLLPGTVRLEHDGFLSKVSKLTFHLNALSIGTKKCPRVRPGLIRRRRSTSQRKKRRKKPSQCRLRKSLRKRRKRSQSRRSIPLKRSQRRRKSPRRRRLRKISTFRPPPARMICHSKRSKAESRHQRARRSRDRESTLWTPTARVPTLMTMITCHSQGRVMQPKRSKRRRRSLMKRHCFKRIKNFKRRRRSLPPRPPRPRSSLKPRKLLSKLRNSKKNS